jgi:tetratricopeptide (TPR) repeat protein
MKKLLSWLIFLALIIAGGYLGYQQYTTTQSPLVFTPYQNEKLQDRSVTLDPATQKMVTERLANIEKTIAAFDEKTDKNDKINNYFAQSADLQMFGRYKEAKIALEKALALKNNAHIIHAYGVLLYQMGAGLDALSYIDLAIAQAPDVPNFWQTKIQLSRELYKGNLRVIEWVYTDGIRKTNEDIDLLTLYASYLAEMGRKQESIQYWQKAIEKNPSARDMYEMEIKNLQ